jgi:hypothetical protein
VILVLDLPISPIAFISSFKYRDGRQIFSRLSQKVTPLWIIRQQTSSKKPANCNYAKRKKKNGFCHVIAAAAFPSLSCFYGSVKPKKLKTRIEVPLKTTSNCETVRNNTLYAFGENNDIMEPTGKKIWTRFSIQHMNILPA